MQAPRVINRVIDTLAVRISRNRHPSDWLLHQLADWRQFVADWEPGADLLAVEFPDCGVFVLRGSSKPFEFTFSNDELAEVRIWKPEKWSSAVGSATGQIMVTFRSKFLQLAGLDAAQLFLDRLEALLVDPSPLPVYNGDWPRPDFCRVARGDLAADIQQDKNLTWAEVHKFVCQSRNLDVFTTLSSEGVYGLLNAVSDGKNKGIPPLDNKGVSILTGATGGGSPAGVAPAFALPEPGPVEAALKTVLGRFAEGVRSELAEGKRGASVTRSVMRGRRPLTVYFGRMTGEIFCKAYDKLAELPVHEKEYMADVWTNPAKPEDERWDGVSPVWRWEFTFTGDFLKSMYIGADRVDVRELSVFLAYVPALWFYCSRKWLRQLDERSLDGRKDQTDRMAISRYWSVVQSAWSSDVGIERDNSRYLRIKDERDAKNRVHQLQQQAAGCIRSAVAVSAAYGTLGLSDTDDQFDPSTGEILPAGESFNLADRVVTMMVEMLGDDFDAAVHKRQQLIGLDDISDAALTSLQRAKMMTRGLGS